MDETGLFVRKRVVVGRLTIGDPIVNPVEGSDERGCEQPREVSVATLEAGETVQMREIATGDAKTVWKRLLRLSTCCSMEILLAQCLLRSLLGRVSLVGDTDETDHVFGGQFVGILLAELLDGPRSKKKREEVHRDRFVGDRHAVTVTDSVSEQFGVALDRIPLSCEQLEPLFTDAKQRYLFWRDHDVG